MVKLFDVRMYLMFFFYNKCILRSVAWILIVRYKIIDRLSDSYCETHCLYTFSRFKMSLFYYNVKCILFVLKGFLFLIYFLLTCVYLLQKKAWNTYGLTLCVYLHKKVLHRPVAYLGQIVIWVMIQNPLLAAHFYSWTHYSKICWRW